MTGAPGDDVPDAMRTEFDTVAAWTSEAVAELGQDFAVVAGCRGSGSPAGLAWLCESLRLEPGTRLLDAGAGVGGPAAYAAEHYGAQPFLTEPMVGACEAARSLFGFPTVAAWGQQLPFADASFDAAWCLGVLCTTTEKAALLAELRRVLGPQGRLGLLVLVQVSEQLPEQPDGNDFPTDASLAALLDEAGFVLVEQVEASQVPPAPLAWQARVDRVDEVVERRHRSSEAWQDAERQGRLMGRLLGEGHVVTKLLSVVATG
ncbi:MAG: methylase involved in ubiquinone/menaquinone biosynthesis [Frankiales bacterium]|nr:methylase involved in ubiquinone/menaquinone biosynthesis [Frankiales bacterium]